MVGRRLSGATFVLGHKCWRSQCRTRRVVARQAATFMTTQAMTTTKRAVTSWTSCHQRYSAGRRARERRPAPQTMRAFGSQKLQLGTSDSPVTSNPQVQYSVAVKSGLIPLHAVRLYFRSVSASAGRTAASNAQVRAPRSMPPPSDPLAVMTGVPGQSGIRPSPSARPCLGGVRLAATPPHPPLLLRRKRGRRLPRCPTPPSRYRCPPPSRAPASPRSP